MSRPPIVYLDTQDYSRFGDVLRGKADSKTEALFIALCQMRRDGKAIFAASMPILAELLQYDFGYRETTIKKAEAVEMLCGPWAMAYPSAIVADEIAQFAERRGITVERPSLLNDERRWFPDIDNVFANLREQMKAAVDDHLKLMNLPRALRRRAKSQARKLDYIEAARNAAVQMAAEYGLPVTAFENSIVALLRGQITDRQASRRLFGAIAEPVKFVEIYFERTENDGSLPTWLSRFGANFESAFATLTAKVEPFRSFQFAMTELDRILDQWRERFGRTLLSSAASEVSQLGIGRTAFDALLSAPDIVRETPSAVLVGDAIVAYSRQVVGLSGSPAKIERSFGGDLVHSLYMPHVDLWRGDRRFSSLLSGTVPQFSNRIVPRPRDLPGAIDRWWQQPTR